MCVISGYLGTQQAAPLLLQMLRREEGFAGGFYTGISTIHEGVLYHEKVVGDVDELIRSTNALQLPGTIGIAHSRTPGGGDRGWAHPFIDTSGKLAYIANGAQGMYAARTDHVAETLRLQKKGHRFVALREDPASTRASLPDGRKVHTCEVACHAIADAYQETCPGQERLLQAVMTAFSRLPGSYVGVSLHADHPDEIAAVRINKPLEVARLRDGATVFASAALAFPDEVEWHFHTPPYSGVRMQRDGALTVRPLVGSQFFPMGAAPSVAGVSGIIESLRGGLTSEQGVQVRDFIDAFIPLWPKDVLNEKEVVAFKALQGLVREGVLRLESRRMPGVQPDLTAPQSFVYWNH